MQEVLLTTQDVGERLKTPSLTVSMWLRKGALRGTKLPSNEWRVRPEDLERMLKDGEKSGEQE